MATLLSTCQKCRYIVEKADISKPCSWHKKHGKKAKPAIKSK